MMFSGVRRILQVAAVLVCLVGSLGYSYGQERKKIIIERADRMKNLKRGDLDIRRLMGNVIIRHEDVTMHSDSAYDYTALNRFDAFGNVVVHQGTSRLYGDTLHYDSHLKTGRVRGEIVRLTDEDMVLRTLYLDFDTDNETVNYYEGAVITTDSAKFSSDRGIYFSKRKIFAFGGNVAYQDDDILLNADSLQYNTESKTIYFFGPTRIYNEENYAYAEGGWYNREEGVTQLQTHAFVDNGEQRAFGNIIYYNRDEGVGRIETNGCVIDTAQNTILYADFIEYFEGIEQVEATINPLIVSLSDEGDSLFLRANRFLGFAVYDSIQTDSVQYHRMKALEDVRFYRTDMQGICDSMYYHSTDSLLTMFSMPVLWNEENQLTATSIDVLFKDENIHRMFFNEAAFVCSQEDSTYFNQIKGKSMVGFFVGGSLNRLEVKGNGQTVYFARDNDKITAVNKAESTDLSIAIRNNEVSSIMFYHEPKATLFPIKEIDIREVTLKDFSWKNDLRPKSKYEIIPPNLKLDFYIPIESKANNYRILKKNPAENL